MGLFIEVCGWDFVYWVCTLGGIEQDLGFYDPARSFPGSPPVPPLINSSTETQSYACMHVDFFLIYFLFLLLVMF